MPLQCPDYDMIMVWLSYDYSLITNDTSWYRMIGWYDGISWISHAYPAYPCPMMSHDPWHSCPFGTKTISPFHLCHNPSYHFTRFHKESKPWDDIGSCNTFNTFQQISPPPMKINPPMILQRQVAKWHCAVGRSGAYLKPEATQHRPLRSEP